MADVFLSYAREDAEVIRELVRELELSGLSVFWDRDITVGSDFEKALEEELAEALCVVVIWSEVSKDSAWVRAEAQDGLGRHVLVPAQIDNTLPPLIFRHLETAQLQGYPEENLGIPLAKFKNSIDRVVGSGANRMPQLVEPMRNDPTLSTRLAKRVMEAMPADDRAAMQLTIGVSKKLNEFFSSLLLGTPWDEAIVKLMSNVAKLTLSDWSVVDEDSGAIIGSSILPHNIELVRQIAAHLTERKPYRRVVIEGEDIDTDDLLLRLNCNWCISVVSSTGKIALLLGVPGTAVPAPIVIESLAYMEVALDLPSSSSAT